MSSDLYTRLSWLPSPPEKFSQQCRTLPEEGLGSYLQSLANYSLDGNQLARVAKALKAARKTGRSLTPLIPFRLGVLSNSTTDFIVPALEASALRYGIALECILGDYGQVVQEALSPESSVNAAKPDAVLLALDARYLPLRLTPGDPEAAAQTVDGILQQFAMVRNGIREHGGGLTIVQNFAYPPEGLFGSYDRVLPGAPRQLLDAVNSGLAQSVVGSEDLLLDVAGIAETVGLANWHSPEQWNLAKLPFADEMVPLYADHVCRLLGAIRGKSRRCLILDLDNTVWGGVIGDDGLDGIRVAQGDATGEAYLSVQRMALSLRERGIVLAVSSKNNDDVARLPFQKHPEMLLREGHIAVFQANWNDKATNIKAIAEELSLGIDAMVFLDDNPAERGLVRQILPQIAVPELPEDPALYARTLAAAGYFESAAYSREDLKRADFYQDNARRVALQKQAGDVDAYLASLDMEITFQHFDQTSRSRISQLINKSNQYNLTTRRYTELQVAEIEADPSCFTLQVRLTDIFGDNGMISVVICRLQQPETWEIDTWLMSCRVLGRRVQEMVLAEIVKHARLQGIHRIVGTYRPSERNAMVKEHYPNLGFSPVSRDENGSSVWTLDPDNFQIKTPTMRVNSSTEV